MMRILIIISLLILIVCGFLGYQEYVRMSAMTACLDNSPKECQQWLHGF